MTSNIYEEFEKYKSRVASAMIGGGEGKRVKQVLERISFSDFEAGWKASRSSLVIELPSRLDMKPYACYENGWNDMYYEVKDIIESFRIKVE